MAATPYTTAEQIDLLAGSVAVDLRTDDGDEDDLVTQAIDYASNQVDYYCHRYSETVLAASHWARDAATIIALKWLCMRRLNDVPAAIQREWDEVWQVQLSDIQKGKAEVPRAPVGRNPASVTNHNVNLRKVNNQIQVDRTRSTGIADGYPRTIDYTAPDQR